MNDLRKNDRSEKTNGVIKEAIGRIRFEINEKYSE
jgi:hypothetical protein